MTEQTTAIRDINKPHCTYWQALYSSFFAKKLYIDVGKRWQKLGIKYLFLMLLIFATPFALRAVFDFNNFIKQQLFQPLKDLPPITVQNGEVFLDSPAPHMAKNSAGQIVSIIDPSGKIKGKNSEYPYLITLITRDKLIYWPPTPKLFFMSAAPLNNSTPIIQTFSPNMNEVFDASAWIESSSIKAIQYLTLAIVFLTVIFMLFGMALTLFLAFTIAAQLFAKLIFKLDLSFAQACRLFIVSATPSIAVLLLGLAVNLHFIGFGILVLALLAIYYSFAIISMKYDSQRMVLL